MTRTPVTAEDMVARAERANIARTDAVRALAKARQNLTDVRADAAVRIAEAEQANRDKWDAALTAGWSEVELTKTVGIAAPEKASKTRRRATTTAKSKTVLAPQPADETIDRTEDDESPDVGVVELP